MALLAEDLEPGSFVQQLGPGAEAGPAGVVRHLAGQRERLGEPSGPPVIVDQVYRDRRMPQSSRRVQQRPQAGCGAGVPLRPGRYPLALWPRAALLGSLRRCPGRRRRAGAARAAAPRWCPVTGRGGRLAPAWPRRGCAGRGGAGRARRPGPPARSATRSPAPAPCLKAVFQKAAASRSTAAWNSSPAWARPAAATPGWTRKPARSPPASVTAATRPWLVSGASATAGSGGSPGRASRCHRSAQFPSITTGIRSSSSRQHSRANITRAAGVNPSATCRVQWPRTAA